MPRPLIAVTATCRPDAPGNPARVRLNAAYLEAVARAGGLGVVAPPGPHDALGDLLDSVGGLLLTGGEDVDPSLYGDVPHPALGAVARERDVWEIALTQAARERGIPTLGLCRGIQVLNVALGGTLIQDIPGQRPDAGVHDQPGARSDRTHPVTVAAGTRLAAILGAEALVNSHHHQAVDALAPGLVATAHAPDGIVEGAEWSADDWWALGVQWHPEELDGADTRLFAALVDAARVR